MAKSQQYGMPLHKTRPDNSNKDIKGHQNIDAEDEDENNSVNWRPLRDFF